MVDHIDGNKSNNDPSNLVAVHCDCANLKHHADYTEQFKRYKKNSNQ
ncbi:HNH endonuclease [bacterium]|nr:HNH endonuclease [bacterium]